MEIGLTFALVLSGCGGGGESTEPKPDTVAPSVSLAKPAHDTAVSTSVVSISGTATDNVGVTRIVYQVNGASEQAVSISPGPSVTFTTDVTVTPGDNVITVSAYDAAGNKGSLPTSPHFLWDASPPQLTVSSPSDASVVTSASVQISGQATDDRQVRRVTTRVNGGLEQDVTITPAAQLAFSQTVTLSAVDNVITITAYDSAGNKTPTDLHIAFDQQPPVTAIQSPVSGSVFTSTTPVSGTANDDVGVATITYSINGGPNQSTMIVAGRNATFSFDAQLQVGANSISVQALDKAGRLSPPTTASVMVIDVRSVVAGQDYSCAIISSQSYCWGANYAGKLGNGSTQNSTIPVAVAGGIAFTSLAVGANSTCGLTGNGDVYCWGMTLGAYNANPPASQSTPSLIGGGLKFQNITVGSTHACGLITTGAAYCWGAGDGALGNGSTAPSLNPVPVFGGKIFKSISAGEGDTCAVATNGAGWCWGNNGSGSGTQNPAGVPDAGKLGDGTGNSSTIPVAVFGGLEFSSIAAGGSHTCGVTASQSAYCWGKNNTGEGGVGNNNTPLLTPTLVVGSLRFESISAGQENLPEGHTCALLVSKSAYCWGQRSAGQLGVGSGAALPNVPNAVIGGLKFESISVGSFHTCALANSGIYCWGGNQSGQLGNGNTTNASEPTKVVMPF